MSFTRKLRAARAKIKQQTDLMAKMIEGNRALLVENDNLRAELAASQRNVASQSRGARFYKAQRDVLADVSPD